MANDTAMTCPASLVKSGFWPVDMDLGKCIDVGIADTKVFVKGELVIDDTNGAATNGAANTTADLWMGVAMESVGSATSTANASTKLKIYVPTLGSDFFWAEASTTVTATMCGPIWDFTDKNTVNVETGASAGEIGFKVYGYDSTNTMVYGVFAIQP